MSYDSILRSAMEDLSEIHEDRMARKLIELSHDDNDVDKSLLERISSYAWEQLHLGPWRDVNVAWRRLYACASVQISKCLMGDRKCEEAMRVLDMANMLGDDQSREMVLEEIRIVEATLSMPTNTTTTTTTTTKKRIRREEKDLIQQKKRIKTTLKGTEIPRVNAPSLLEFKSKIMKSRSPVIVTNAMNAWPAMKRWSDVSYLRRVAGHRTIPVEYGKHYMDSNWSQKLIRFDEFLRDHIYSTGKETAYLAQHRLFDQIPTLANDIMTPDYCCLQLDDKKTEDEVEINAWFGPAWTVSNLHHDPKHNLLAQVVGQKYIRLYKHEHSSGLYPHDGLMSNTSQVVDVENPTPSTLKKFPLFHDTPFFDCVLKPGEMLYIPPKEWHYVRSLETSFSVSFWWS